MELAGGRLQFHEDEDLREAFSRKPPLAYATELHLVCISLVFLSTIACGWVIVYLQAVLKPLILGVFLAYLLAPAVDLLTRPFSPRAALAWLRGDRAERCEEDEEMALVIGPRATRAVNKAEDLVACPHSVAVLVVLSLTSLLLIFLVNLVVSSVASLEEKFPKCGPGRPSRPRGRPCSAAGRGRPSQVQGAGHPAHRVCTHYLQQRHAPVQGPAHAPLPARRR